MPKPFITRVTIENYKSIGFCQVDLGNPTFLVGPNGSGKSNFLDAIKFVSDVLSNGLSNAVHARSGFQSILNVDAARNRRFSIRIDFHSNLYPNGHYSLQIEPGFDSDAVVSQEECEVQRPGSTLCDTFRIESGKVISESTNLPIPVDTGYTGAALIHYAGLSSFRPVVDALTGLDVYSIDPRTMRQPQPDQSATVLRADGVNAANLIKKVSAEDLALIEGFLRDAVPGILNIEKDTQNSFDFIRFVQTIGVKKHKFNSHSMSDGTLRFLGILLALFQNGPNSPKVVCIEEPEMALHPAALRVLLRAIDLASERRQIIVTSHSPELLDNPDIDESSLVSVVTRDGSTYIGGFDEPCRSVIRDGLFTPGELLRQNQIDVDTVVLGSSPESKEKLFFEVGD